MITCFDCFEGFFFRFYRVENSRQKLTNFALHEKFQTYKSGRFLSTGKFLNDKAMLWWINQKIKEIESDITVGRVLVRPSGTESKIRIMIEAPEESVAIKFVNDIEKLIRSKIK